MYIEPHITPYAYGSETHFVVKCTGLRDRFECHRLESPIARVVYYAFHEHPPYPPSFISTYEAYAYVTLLVPLVLVNQSKTDQLSSGIRHRVVPVAEFISLPEPVSVYGFTHESTGVLPQTLVEKFVRAQDGHVVH